MAPPVRTPAVVVGEAVLARQLPRAEEQARARRTFGSAASAAIARPTNSGDSDTRKFESFLPASRQVSSVTPKCSQHGFRAEEAGRDGEDGDAMRRELGGPLERQHLLRHS